MKYLQIEDIKRQLTIEHDMDNELLSTLGTATEDAIERYIGQPIANTFVDGQIPASLKQAMLMFVGSLYNNRESETMSSAMPRTIAAYEILLGPFRKY